MNVEEGMITEQEGDQWEGGGGITEYWREGNYNQSATYTCMKKS
jgi:hypothetical protein